MSAKLVLQVVSHARECVAPLLPQFVRNVFIASGEGNRLKRDRLHFVDILRSKLDDLADAVVVEIVDDRYHKCDFDTGFSEVLDRSQLNVE